MRPKIEYEIFDGMVKIMIFGKPLTLENHHILSVNQTLKLGIKELLWPQTSAFNARVVEPTDFVRGELRDEVILRTICSTDGVKISSPGQAVCLQTADCPTIICANMSTDEIVVAHAGRDSLIDQSTLRNQAGRGVDSVVFNISQTLNGTAEPHAQYLRVHSCCGISGEDFSHPLDHPEFGALNQKLISHIIKTYGRECVGCLKCGTIDLHTLIKNQFMKIGVPSDQISQDSINTARDPVYFSRRGGDQEGHNTILVWRIR